MASDAGAPEEDRAVVPFTDNELAASGPVVMNATRTTTHLIEGGVFEKANLGQQTFNVTKNVVHHVTNIVHQPPTPAQEEEEEEQNQEQEDSGLLQLSSRLTVFEKDPISADSRIFRGVLKSDVTGDQNIVIKILPDGRRQRREAMVHFSVPYHKNIVHRIMTDTFIHRGLPSIYIAMECCHSQNLYQYIKYRIGQNVPFEAARFMSFGHQIACGLEFLHSHKILNGDLKPHNILLDHTTSIVKIADFGLSKPVFGDQQPCAKQTSLHAGTDGWKSPEVLEGAEKISTSSDIFSLGLAFYFMWSYGKHPFGQNPHSWNHYILHNENLLLDELLIPDSDHGKELILLMLNHDPAERPTTRDILRHAIFNSEGATAPEKADSVLSNEIEESLVRLRIGDGFSLRRIKGGDYISCEQGEDLKRSCMLQKILHENDLTVIPVREAVCCFEFESRSLRVYNTNEKKWIRMHGMSNEIMKCMFSAVTLDGAVYVLMESKAVYRLEYRNGAGTWKRLADMDKSHGLWPPTVALDESIYVVGCARSMIAPTVEQYQPRCDRWVAVTDMVQLKMDHCVAAVEGHIYCIGGCDARGKAMRAVEKFDTISGTWTISEQMKSPRILASAAVKDSLIYVLGGWDDCNIILRSAEVYNLRTNAWTSIRNMKKPRSIFSALCISNKLYAVGGDGSDPQSVEEYDFVDKQWKMVTVMEGMRHRRIASVVLKI